MEVVAAGLLHALDPSRYDPHLVCFEETNGIIPRIDTSRVSLEVVRKGPGADPRQVLRLARHFRRVRPNLVHTFNPEALIFGWPAARLARVPALVHAYHGRTGQIEPPLFRAVRRWMMRRADHVVVVSEELKDLAVREDRVSAEKITTILNGIDLGAFEVEFDRSAFRAGLGLSDEDWAVCTLGSLQPLKNQQLLIRAAARVRDLKAFLVGGGALEETLGALAEELGVEDRVTLLGERTDVPRVLRAMDIFALTSTTEGTSIALLEAMAAGLPAVVTDVGGNGKLVVHGETGFLIEPGDVGGLTERLEWSFQQREECRSMGEAARRRARDSFSFSRMVEAYDEVFRATLRGKVRGFSAA
jgi:glycosyltransferase involved in cell wall biosynthesis